MTDDIYAAISREKELKKWRREKKVILLSRLILLGRICIMIYLKTIGNRG